MGLPLPLATCLSWVGPPSNLGGGGSARAVFPSSQSVSDNTRKIYRLSISQTHTPPSAPSRTQDTGHCWPVHGPVYQKRRGVAVTGRHVSDS